MIARVLRAFSTALKKLPKNQHLWCYVIETDSSPYITRIILPRLLGRRPMIHWIHRADLDGDPHNHPWRRAWSLILSGGYREERPGVPHRSYFSGDVNRISDVDFHRITSVLPDTWTLFVAGERSQSWGFLTKDGYVNHETYKRGRVAPGVGA
jgi:hypothetical protein